MRYRIIGVFLCALSFFYTSCNHRSDFTSIRLDAARAQEIIEKAPFLTAEESMKAIQLEEGFSIELVAAEPLVAAPVALAFDEKERIWVVEMAGYMPDTLGTGEDIPNGKIVILEDLNGDGKADNRKVFMDSLVLPRAISLVENGILVAVPPRLLFVEIVNDKPGSITIVDEEYNKGGNVEHEANGLLRGIDNWIYSANSSKRYRKKGDQWLTDITHGRGQWGISQDDYGRLYYNNNSQNLLGDYFLPGLGAGNRFLKPVPGFNVRIVEDNRVYPARPTTGVNRGYKEDVLDSTGRLIDFTAACGPLLYRSNLFGKAYYNNVFVAEPSANLVKRNIVHEEGFLVKGRQAYKNEEFLTSIDERFRPVNLHTAPDGSMYIADMYRGIIQHRYYLTEYLKEEIRKRALTLPLHAGRIYRVAPVNTGYKRQQVPEDPLSLVSLLTSGNAWLRETAQRKLVDNRHTEAADSLRAILRSDNKIARIHAFWTLEGLGVLQKADIDLLLEQDNWKLRMHALAGIPSILNHTNRPEWLDKIAAVIQSGDTLVMPTALFQLKHFRENSAVLVDDILTKAAIQHRNNPYIQGAILSNIAGTDTRFYQRVLSQVSDTASVLHKRFISVITNIHKEEAAKNEEQLKKKFPAGSAIYATVCQNCHGVNGEGLALLAPPLNNSNWVTGSIDKLTAIVLKGLTGPVHVNNKLYKAPEISGDMPGVGGNADITDEGLAELLSFIRKNWNNSADEVKPEEVKAMREKLKDRELPFTEEELNNW